MTQALDELSKLGKRGLIGIMAALISLVGYSLWAVNSSTNKSIEGNEKTMELIQEITHESNKVIRDNTTAIQELTDFIKFTK